MAHNRFGKLFTFTSFGESHGPMMGVVIDGCPSGLRLDSELIAKKLEARRPGSSTYTSPRSEPDNFTIVSGLHEGITTGAPIAILIPNQDAKSEQYEPLKQLYRPGHANYSWLKKWNHFDWRGGGRASARETVCRVAAGAVAQQLLMHYDISLSATLVQVGCCTGTEKELLAEIERTKQQGDSLGGTIAFKAEGNVEGLGEPIYNKMEAALAAAMLSIPASKGFEIGEGFDAASMMGSEHNDQKCSSHFLSNHAGGTLGGVATGQAIYGRVAFKPTSSVRQKMQTTTLEGEETSYTLPAAARHDPCLALRAVPVVEAMLALVLADFYLLNRSARL